MPKIKGVYKRGNIWWIRYVGPDGRMRYESTKGASHREAQAILHNRKQEVMEGKDPLIARRIKNNTLIDLAEIYLKWSSRQKAFRCKKIFISQIIAYFGDLPLDCFNTRCVEEWQTSILEENKPATVNRKLATLKHMFTKAVEWDMATEEILKKIRRVHLLPLENKRLRYLSKEECHILIEACQNHLKPIVITALNTGMRKSEILSLKWDKHIDLRHGFILLDKTKNGERREIPINNILKKTLSRIIRRLDTSYVFHNNDGKRYKDIKHSWQTAVKRAGIKDFRFHDLRHTFASQLVMAGVDIVTVKELLGHKSLIMTLRYAHLAPSHKKKALSILEKTLEIKPNNTKTIQTL